MNTAPDGRMMTRKAFRAPVVTAASCASPRCATISASQKPITDCEARANTMGQAN
jgi:hypothetical protein